MCHSRIISPSKASGLPTLFPLHLPRAEMFALRRSDENEPVRKILPARSASRVQHRLGASGSFLPLPHPLLLIFALSPFFARAKRRKPRFFFALCSSERLATQATCEGRRDPPLARNSRSPQFPTVFTRIAALILNYTLNSLTLL